MDESSEWKDRQMWSSSGKTWTIPEDRDGPPGMVDYPASHGQYQRQFYFFHLSINVLCLGAESGGGEGQDVLSSGTFKGTMSVDLHFL